MVVVVVGAVAHCCNDMSMSDSAMKIAWRGRNSVFGLSASTLDYGLFADR